MEITSRFIKTGHSWRLDTREPGRSRGSKRMSVAMAAAGSLAQWWALEKSVFTWVGDPFTTAFPFSVSFSMHVEIEDKFFWTETSFSVHLHSTQFHTVPISDDYYNK